MSHPIKYLQLTKTELIYEVKIRAEEPKERVEELRQQISKLAIRFPSEEVLDSCYDFDDDIAGVKHTLAKAAINVACLKQDPQQRSLLERTQTFLNHIHHRLNRICSPDASPEKSALLNETKQFYNDQWSSFQEILASLPQGDAQPTAAPKRNKALATSNLTSQDNFTDDSSELNTNADISNPEGANNYNIKVTCDRGLSSDISKLKYDGKSCVRAFIARAKEFRLAKDVTDKKMLSLATEIFTGDALHWFRSVKETVHSWEDLLNMLKSDFDVANFDYLMRREISNRSQGPSESITVYLAIMHGMFSRLDAMPSERERLEIILHNIRPCYSSVLATCPNLNSLTELRTLCRNYEQIKARSDNFKEPPAVSSSTLAPEYCYQPRKDAIKSSSKAGSANYQATPNYSQTFSKPSFSKFQNVSAIAENKYCYRCRVNSHSMRECTAERTILCFKCGLQGFRFPDCPQCHPSKKKETCAIEPPTETVPKN
ncbi:uncharacterized protein LOC125235314 [Leguminivora glycinivorella]|uniref:uncharacterized protein LOC125235314 n=1 Tax=Leguminivora glycinivorella TaxID=1035111 RepID=UPI00200D3EF7|nr:uncharacterized protein LOC125235314 [Leguminivora glycinivorella]